MSADVQRQACVRVEFTNAQPMNCHVQLRVLGVQVIGQVRAPGVQYVSRIVPITLQPVVPGTQQSADRGSQTSSQPACVLPFQVQALGPVQVRYVLEAPQAGVVPLQPEVPAQ